MLFILSGHRLYTVKNVCVCVCVRVRVCVCMFVYLYIYIYIYIHTHTHTPTHTHICDCVESVYELPLLPDNTGPGKLSWYGD